MNKDEEREWEYNFIEELINIGKNHCPRFSAKMITKILFIITDDKDGNE